MKDNPAFDAFLDATLREVLTEIVGSFDESMADSYIPQIRAATLAKLDAAGYQIIKKGTSK